MKKIKYCILAFLVVSFFYSCTPQSLEGSLDEQSTSSPNERRKASEPVSGD